MAAFAAGIPVGAPAPGPGSTDPLAVAGFRGEWFSLRQRPSPFRAGDDLHLNEYRPQIISTRTQVRLEQEALQ